MHVATLKAYLQHLSTVFAPKDRGSDSVGRNTFFVHFVAMPATLTSSSCAQGGAVACNAAAAEGCV